MLAINGHKPLFTAGAFADTAQHKNKQNLVRKHNFSRNIRAAFVFRLGGANSGFQKCQWGQSKVAHRYLYA